MQRILFVSRRQTLTSFLQRRHNLSTRTSTEEPFYGRPRKHSSTSTTNASSSRISLFLQNAVQAFQDPTRADAVAAVGELTGEYALRDLLQCLRQHPDGKRILRDRPLVQKQTIPYERLIELARQQQRNKDTSNPKITFGTAYGSFLLQHGFDPDERDDVRYLEDPDLAYVMLRYRQCHDYWHALTGLPPTVLGELALKWLELFQTGLPLAALSATVGSLRLTPTEQAVLWKEYLPWAQEMSKKLPYGTMMNIYYEEEFDTPLEELRNRIGLDPAPIVTID